MPAPVARGPLAGLEGEPDEDELADADDAELEEDDEPDDEPEDGDELDPDA